MFPSNTLIFLLNKIQIHLWERDFAEFLSWWEQLEEAGLRPFWTEPNLVCVTSQQIEYRWSNTTLGLRQLPS